MHTCEALILKTVRYRARDQVVTAFSGTRGLFSFFMKGTKTRPMLEPLMLCELVTAESKGELERLIDVSILNRYEKLRETLSRLKAASQIASLLLKTQLPLKPAPALFACTLAHFDWLMKTEKPTHAIASFQMKLLKCEGLIKLSKTCTQCDRPAISIQRGESLCENHLGPFDLGAYSNSLNPLLELYELKKFEAIEKIALSEDNFSDVRKLFEEQTEAYLQLKS